MEHPKRVLPHQFGNNIQKLWIEGLLILIKKMISGWKPSLFFVLSPKQRMLFDFTWLELQLSVSQNTNIFYTKNMDEIPQMAILLPTPQKIGGKATLSKLNPGKAVSPWFKTESSQPLSHAIFVMICLSGRKGHLISAIAFCSTGTHFPHFSCNYS